MLRTLSQRVTRLLFYVVLDWKPYYKINFFFLALKQNAGWVGFHEFGFLRWK